ncbi:hypothetical protein [uncultured Victivallis sp.]|uniref:hypothetical protein n=1 Tax=uncultured Victivallis sp. TaxID=354118 RepID=UPI0025EA3B3D|nr:hypothetical protein [uncultured Victivallis sp.]
MESEPVVIPRPVSPEKTPFLVQLGKKQTGEVTSRNKFNAPHPERRFLLRELAFSLPDSILLFCVERIMRHPIFLKEVRVSGKSRRDVFPNPLFISKVVLYPGQTENKRGTGVPRPGFRQSIVANKQNIGYPRKHVPPVRHSVLEQKDIRQRDDFRSQIFIDDLFFYDNVDPLEEMIDRIRGNFAHRFCPGWIFFLFNGNDGISGNRQRPRIHRINEGSVAADLHQKLRQTENITVRRHAEQARHQGEKKQKGFHCTSLSDRAIFMEKPLG